MRITVGHVLILGGVGTFLVLGPLKKFDREEIVIKSELWFQTTVSQIKGLLGGKIVSPAPVVPKEEPLPAPKSSDVVSSEPVAPVPPVTTPKAVPPVPAENTMDKTAEEALSALLESEPATPKVSKKKNKRLVRKRRLKKRAAPAQPREAASAKPQAPAAQGSDPLMNSYVALQLKSGREVKGVLRGKSPTHYKLEVPGLGVFDYAMDNVSGIKSAE